jgi:(p)ppGpp synthase/HD superfamily hydrolase
MTHTHAKERIALRHWLLGREWYKAAEAFTYAETFHCGLRKDGVTPEFNHQVQVALYLSTLTPHLLFPQETITTALLHDVPEDFDVEFAEIESLFGNQVAEATHACTKVHKGSKRDPHEVKAAQESNPIASPVKGADRIHNQSTMAGVFSNAKILEYVEETETFILPMLKAARRRFPSQDGAYQNERVVLLTQNAAMRHFASNAA